MRAVVLTAILMAIPLATGCASRCEAVCEKVNTCSLAERSTDVDCGPFCSDVESFQQRAVTEGQASCDEQWQAHLSCWENNSAQICDQSFADCKAKGQEWSDCMTAYCAAVASQSKTDPSCSKGKPTLLPF